MLLTVAIVVLAAEPAPAEAVRVIERPSAAAQTGAHFAFAGGVLLSSVLAAALSYFPGTLHSARTGRPEPLVPTTAMIFAGAAKVAISYWLLPELYRVGGGTPDIEATRQGMWRLARWPALTALVSIAVLIVGAGLDYGNFGRGQNVMIGGFSGLIASVAAFDILALVGSSQGYRR